MEEWRGCVRDRFDVRAAKKGKMGFWQKHIVVTGGAGFLGSSIVSRLHDLGAENVFVPRSSEYDLRDRDSVVRMMKDAQPQLLLHLAASAGGIGANRSAPGKFFYDNAIMGIQVIEEARRFGVEKTLVVGTVCSYPRVPQVPFQEKDLWDGYPEETNAPYGLAKKMLLVQAQAYRNQYDMDISYVIPVNLYGPRDSFDLETSHVIPSLIRKFLEARNSGEDHVVLWGTGSPTREFLYVRDAAHGILMALQHYNSSEPVNLGSGEEISIRELALMIGNLVGFSGELKWDASKPDGQPRRLLDTSRASKEFGFSATTTLADGLSETISWARKNLSFISL